MPRDGTRRPYVCNRRCNAVAYSTDKTSGRRFATVSKDDGSFDAAFVVSKLFRKIAKADGCLFISANKPNIVRISLTMRHYMKHGGWVFERGSDGALVACPNEFDLCGWVF